ncbi:hypothetical protein [Streptomyces sp. NPDC017448]|uniref:hypothetical protein n=1 Tax=Streptomyces sp. NPDC017448 TaxID=3364996 RepID=UPI003798A0EE
MIIVRAPDHFVALTYDPAEYGLAHLCMYELHGDNGIEVRPVLDGGGRQVALSVDTFEKEKPEILEELERLLPVAVDLYEMINAAANSRLFRPEDATEEDEDGPESALTIDELLSRARLVRERRREDFDVGKALRRLAYDATVYNEELKQIRNMEPRDFGEPQ